MVTGATLWNYPQPGKSFILVFNEALWAGRKSDNTLVNPNQMRHHCINVKENPCMKKPMGITSLQEDVTISLYMAVMIFLLKLHHQQNNSWSIVLGLS